MIIDVTKLGQNWRLQIADNVMYLNTDNLDMLGTRIEQELLNEEIVKNETN